MEQNVSNLFSNKNVKNRNASSTILYTPRLGGWT